MKIACRHIGAIALFILTGFPSAGTAQDRLFLEGSELGAFGRFGEPIGPARGLDRQLAGGGRYRVPELIEGETDIIDLRTGARRALPAGTAVAAVDPARPRLILSRPMAQAVDVVVFDIVTGVAETVLSGACGSGTLAYAYDAQVVVTRRCSGSQVEELVAIDLSTFAPAVRPLPIAGQFGAIAVSADGQRLYGRTSTGFLTSRIDAHDLASGARLGSAIVDGEMQWDDAFDALLVVGGGGFVDSQANLFSRAMERLGTVVIPTRICPARIQVSPHTGRVYVTTNGASNTGALPAVVEVFAGVPLRSAGRATVAPLGQLSCRGVMVRTAPGAPRGLSATVSGRDVALDWTNVGGASAFVLDVGLAAGRTDLSIFMGPESRVSFAEVPSGTYHLRVRGANEFGGGRPSEEVRVVVP
jgi:hypothetical protein